MSYHFSVTDVVPKETYTFILRGLSGQGKLYNAGLRPVYKTFPGENKWKIVEYNNIPGNLNWRTEVDGFYLKFTHIFESKSQTVHFAFTYPFSYQESIK